RVVAAQILLSSEYFTSAGQVLWVERVYQDALGRSASQAELAGWVSLLHAGTTRTQVAIGIANSPEANAYLINKLYQSLLGRSADAAALVTFTAQLQAGGHVADIVNTLVASQEYSNLKGGTDDGWVRGLYQDLLGRTPADSEVAIWVGALSTSTRAQV